MPKVENREIREETIRLPIEEATDHKASYCDGSFVTMKIDDVSAMVEISGTRNDTQLRKEIFKARNDGKMIRQTAPSVYDPQQRKIIESTFIMRPDHAYNLAISVIDQISKMPDEIKFKFNIPTIQVS